MNISFEINGLFTTTQADPDEKLLSVLRKHNLYSVKSGCEQGKCGFCTVLLNGEPVPSCKVPVGIVQNSRVETLEHFSMSKDYEIIMDGFEKAGVKLCGFCNSAKIFATYKIINSAERPEKNELIEVADTVRCDCTERDSFMNGVYYALALKHETEGRRRDGR